MLKIGYTRRISPCGDFLFAVCCAKSLFSVYNDYGGKEGWLWLWLLALVRFDLYTKRYSPAGHAGNTVCRVASCLC